MHPMLATAFGNGPYLPVVVYKGRYYPVGHEFEEMEDALKEAQGAIQTIRAELRCELPEGYRW